MSENLKQLKYEIRNTIKQKRRQLSDAYIEYADQAIAGRILNLAEFQQAETVFCFVSTPQEINTFPVLEAVIKQKKKLAVPKCLSPGVMKAYHISNLDQLTAGKYGILEPETGCEEVESKEIDFAVIPCICADRQGGRVGHGGGYYDRYLNGKVYPAAVICRAELLCEKAPAESWDQVMDFVITEKETIITKRDT